MAYFLRGSTAIPRGFTKNLLTIVALCVELSKFATSIVSFSESVQYRRREIQSTAMPSGDEISERKNKSLINY